jgi:HlyD family secretion protein
MKRILLAIGLVAAVAVSIALAARNNAAGATSYRMVSVTRGDIESRVEATGLLSAVSTVQVGTQVSGKITELHADFNDRVKRGQLIARIDATLLEQAVRQAKSDLARAEADVKQKKFFLDQAEALYKSRAMTETEYTSAQYNSAVAASALVSAQASLERAEQNLAYTNIYAPIDGVVIERNVEIGQTVAASMSTPQIFLIAEDLSNMQILASVDESDIGVIKEGQDVSFTVQAFPNRTFHGTVNQVRMQSTTAENVVNYTVVVKVRNPDGALLPGMTATVSFQVAKAENVLRVPNAALRFQPTDEMLAAYRAAHPSEPTDAPMADSPRGGQPVVNGAPRAPGAQGGNGAQRGNGATGGNDSASLARRRAADVGQVWYTDASGVLQMVRVRTGLSNGQLTEVTGAGLKEGLELIAGVTSAAAAEGPANPFQQNDRRRGPGGRF